MWTFKITEGKLYHDAVSIAPAYSGAPGHVDQPADEALVGKGPLPEGWYTMGRPIDSPHTGPFSIPLTPDITNMEYERSDFFIHGDSIHAPGTASHGCIVTGRETRAMMWDSGDYRLQVSA